MGSLDGRKDTTPTGVDHDSVFGSVPSKSEVEKAISELQSFMDKETGASSQSSELNQLNEMLNNDSRIVQSSGYRRVQKAYQLLKTESSVRKMVVSISSDKAVWDAVLSNKAVQDLKGSLQKAKQSRHHKPKVSVEEPDLASLILRWILQMTMSKFGEMMAKFGLIVGDIFQTKMENPSSEVEEVFEETVKSSFLLSVVVLLVVVVARGHGAPLH